MDRKAMPKTDLITRFDALYQREEHVWCVEPSTGVEEALPFLKPGRVLDLGSGDGRNALFLANRGFVVTAVDIVPAAIANLMLYAERAKLQEKIHGIVADAETYRPEGQFENVVSTLPSTFCQKFHIYLC